MIDEMDDNLYPVEMFDLLLPDIHSKEMHEEISEKLKIKYLSDSLYTELNEVDGIMFGLNYRIFVTLPVQIKQKVKNVHFLVDTGSPKTFICNEIYDAFKVTIANASSSRVLINNKPIIAQLPPINSHFMDVNLLGTEYLKTFDAKLIVDFENEYVYMSFGSSQLGFYILSGIVGFVLLGLTFFIFKRRPLFFYSVMVLFLFYNAFNFIQNIYY